jgi:hypothetical protein
MFCKPIAREEGWTILASTLGLDFVVFIHSPGLGLTIDKGTSKSRTKNRLSAAAVEREGDFGRTGFP